jgi:hypothetical protein
MCVAELSTSRFPVHLLAEESLSAVMEHLGVARSIPMNGAKVLEPQAEAANCILHVLISMLKHELAISMMSRYLCNGYVVMGHWSTKTGGLKTKAVEAHVAALAHDWVKTQDSFVSCNIDREGCVNTHWHSVSRLI